MIYVVPHTYFSPHCFLVWEVLLVGSVFAMPKLNSVSQCFGCQLISISRPQPITSSRTSWRSAFKITAEISYHTNLACPNWIAFGFFGPFSYQSVALSRLDSLASLHHCNDVGWSGHPLECGSECIKFQCSSTQWQWIILCLSERCLSFRWSTGLYW